MLEADHRFNHKTIEFAFAFDIRSREIKIFLVNDFAFEQQVFVGNQPATKAVRLMVTSWVKAAPCGRPLAEMYRPPIYSCSLAANR